MDFSDGKVDEASFKAVGGHGIYDYENDKARGGPVPLGEIRGSFPECRHDPTRNQCRYMAHHSNK